MISDEEVSRLLLLGAAATSTADKVDQIIESERIESGSVKLRVFAEYLRRCNVAVFVAAFCMFVSVNAFDLAANFWLSDWANKSSDDTERSRSAKFYRLSVYFALGLAKSKYIYIQL